jgi:ABC-type arginine/histidine transport system permease subunit
MTDYMQMLVNICFTIITLVIVAGGVGTLIAVGLAILKMINDHID